MNKQFIFKLTILVIIIIILLIKFNGLLCNNNINSFNILSNEIHLLSYNMYLLPIQTNEYNTFDTFRMNEFINKIDKYNIICLQEVFTNNYRQINLLLKKCEEKGYNYYFIKTPTFFSQYLINSGLLILSKFKIYDRGFLPFFHNKSYDSLSEKGILYIKIICNNKPIYVFNTHLQANYSYNLTTSYKKIMESQLKYIIDTLNNYKYNNSIILTGDFNVDNKEYKLSNLMHYNELIDTIPYNKYIYTYINYYDKNSNEVINYKPFFCKRSKNKIEKYKFHTKKFKIDYVFYYPKYIRLISSSIVDFNIKHKYLTHLSDHKAVYAHFYSL